MENLYVNNEKVAYSGEEFIHETSINLYFTNYFSKINSKTFYSKEELNFIESFFVNKYIEIETELIQAPEHYLINNGYRLYIKEPKKKKK